MPSMPHKYDQFRFEVKPVLKSKIEEFQLLGYDTIIEDDLWEYLTRKKWRRPSEFVRISEIVQDIMHVKVGEYMNFATVEAYKSVDFMSVLSEEDKKKLLK